MGGPSGSGFANATPAVAATSRPTWNGNPTTSGTITRREIRSFMHAGYSGAVPVRDWFRQKAALAQRANVAPIVALGELTLRQNPRRSGNEMRA